MTGSSPVLFRIYDHDVDLPIVASILGIILLALIQLSWPYIQSYLQPSPNIQERPVPVIETISEDPVPEAPKRRFVKDQSMIADWAAQAPLGTNGLSDRDDPNGISGMEGMKEVMVDSDGKVLDLDGSIIEPGTIAYIRQQMIDRVINSGTTGDDENESAVMKLDIIKSIRELTDANVIEWYIHNKEMLRY